MKLKIYVLRNVKSDLTKWLSVGDIVMIISIDDVNVSFIQIKLDDLENTRLNNSTISISKKDFLEMFEPINYEI